MTAPLTHDDIARMLADAELANPWANEGTDGWNACVRLEDHVRALAAELLAHKGALHDESLEGDQWQLKCSALAAECERLRKELLLRSAGKGEIIISETYLDELCNLQLETRAQRDEARAQLEAVTRERDLLQDELNRHRDSVVYDDKCAHEGDGLVCQGCAQDVANERDRYKAALEQAARCITCEGTGRFMFVVDWKYDGPHEPKEITEEGECPECDGSKIGAHVGTEAREALKGAT